MSIFTNAFARIRELISPRKGSGSVQEQKMFETPATEIKVVDVIADIFEDDDPPPKKTQAESLPDGWIWVDNYDGSGGLYAPDGSSCFGYDLATGYTAMGGIEYKESREKQWDVFWGCLSEFKEFAEEKIAKTLGIATQGTSA